MIQLIGTIRKLWQRLSPLFATQKYAIYSLCVCIETGQNIGLLLKHHTNHVRKVV